MPRRKSVLSVTAECAHPKSAASQLPDNLRRRIQPLPMNFLVPPVERPDHAEADNPAGQEIAPPVFIDGNEYCPIFPLPPFALGTRPRGATRSGHVKDEKTARNKNVMDPVE